MLTSLLATLTLCFSTHPEPSRDSASDCSTVATCHKITQHCTSVCMLPYVCHASTVRCLQYCHTHRYTHTYTHTHTHTLAPSCDAVRWLACFRTSITVCLHSAKRKVADVYSTVTTPNHTGTRNLMIRSCFPCKRVLNASVVYAPCSVHYS